MKLIINFMPFYIQVIQSQYAMLLFFTHLYFGLIFFAY
jgi:hypothetical protein